MGADAEVVGDGEAGEEVTFGSVVSLVVGGAGRPGGDVARGAGQGGSRELAASSRNCPMASSRVPAGDRPEPVRAPAVADPPVSSDGSREGPRLSVADLRQLVTRAEAAHQVRLVQGHAQ